MCGSIYLDQYIYVVRGWRSGERARLPPMYPGFDSRALRHMWFFSGLSGFPPSTKINTSKFQFDLETVDDGLHFVEMPLQISIYLFIYSLQNVHDKSMKLGKYENTKKEVTESQMLY